MRKEKNEILFFFFSYDSALVQGFPFFAQWIIIVHSSPKKTIGWFLFSNGSDDDYITVNVLSLSRMFNINSSFMYIVSRRENEKINDEEVKVLVEREEEEERTEKWEQQFGLINCSHNICLFDRDQKKFQIYRLGLIALSWSRLNRSQLNWFFSIHSNECVHDQELSNREREEFSLSLFIRWQRPWHEFE